MGAKASDTFSLYMHVEFLSLYRGTECLPKSGVKLAHTPLTGQRAMHSPDRATLPRLPAAPERSGAPPGAPGPAMCELTYIARAGDGLVLAETWDDMNNRGAAGGKG